jgi:hypothetical protein
MQTNVTPSTFTLDALRPLYQWDQIKDWRLLAEHFRLVDDRFAFIEVLARMALSLSLCHSLCAGVERAWYGRCFSSDTGRLLWRDLAFLA